MPIATDLHKAQTKQFILENPAYLVLRRFTRIADGAGGFKPSTETVLDAQEVRVVHQTRQTPRVTEDGRNVIVDKSVVGMSDFDVAISDTFTYNEQKYEVINVQDEPGWGRIVAEAIHHG